MQTMPVTNVSRDVKTALENENTDVFIVGYATYLIAFNGTQEISLNKQQARALIDMLQIVEATLS